MTSDVEDTMSELDKDINEMIVKINALSDELDAMDLKKRSVD